MHIKRIDIQQINLKYEALFMSHVQELVAMRIHMRITQSKMAYWCGVSLRTIQKLEAFECFNYKILFTYREILKQ